MPKRCSSPACAPPPYLASRGTTWIQRQTPETIDDAALRDDLTESHQLVVLGLPNKVQRELGLTRD